jgi:hypothetical protein
VSTSMREMLILQCDTLNMWTCYMTG